MSDCSLTSIRKEHMWHPQLTLKLHMLYMYCNCMLYVCMRLARSYFIRQFCQYVYCAVRRYIVESSRTTQAQGVCIHLFVRELLFSSYLEAHG